MQLTARALTIAALVLSSACKTGSGGSTPPAVSIRDAGAHTIVVSLTPEGAIHEDHTGDPELVGTKQVELTILVRAPTLLKEVRLTWWPAGNRPAERSIVREVDEAYDPPPGGLSLGHRFLIPGSAELEPCDALYYMWTVVYEDAAGRPALYVGQPKRIMPTKRRLPGGTIERVECEEPPGP